MRISDWSSDVCSSDLTNQATANSSKETAIVMNRAAKIAGRQNGMITFHNAIHSEAPRFHAAASSEGSICDNLSLTMAMAKGAHMTTWEDRKSTRLNSSH